jgi:putative membrane protein
MFLWTKPLGLKTFRQTLEKATDKAVLAANQGLITAARRRPDLGTGSGHARLRVPDQGIFLGCVIVAGVYGAITVSRRILFVQALPAAIALIPLILA